jgi:fructose-bisphosphate aldolase, class I
MDYVLDKLPHLTQGKRARLHRLMYEFGPGNGRMMFLPVDQGLEHGPMDFFANPESLNPEFEIKLAIEGGFSGVVFQYGISAKYMYPYAGRVPLVVKINGKTAIPSEKEAFSSLIASVEDAVRLGADAIGYTLYVGSPAQAMDFQQFRLVREAAERLGMPVIVWAYPRGEAIEAKGGRDSLYAIDYAARVADELGADVVKVNMPKTDEKSRTNVPTPYNTLELGLEEATRKVVTSAGKTLVLFSGGSRLDEQDVLEKARVALDAGATGLIFGRNVWQRSREDALRLAAKIRELMATH